MCVIRCCFKACRVFRLIAMPADQLVSFSHPPPEGALSSCFETSSQRLFNLIKDSRATPQQIRTALSRHIPELHRGLPCPVIFAVPADVACTNGSMSYFLQAPLSYEALHALRAHCAFKSSYFVVGGRMGSPDCLDLNLARPAGPTHAPDGHGSFWDSHGLRASRAPD